MTVNSRFETLALTFALGLPCFASLGLMYWAPGRVTPTNLAVVVALFLGSATVGMHTWKSAQATGSVGQLIYETNTGRRNNTATPWRVIAAILVLSTAATALVVTTWLS